MKTSILLSWLALALAALPVCAAEDTVAPARSGTSGKTAVWTGKFTLEAGDVVNIRLYGVEGSERTGVTIGPDGRLSYLQAADVLVAGLTVDELRARLDEELGKFIRNARTVVTPVAYNSKKYYVLGAVQRKGVFPFTRPLTLIEAIANAGGLQTGLYNQKAVELADLQRSFLVRRGERVKVDFEKLFQHGDLKQNIALEPGDFLYFPPASLNEVYVLGEVVTPGVVPFVASGTAISAVTQCGGFTSRAYRQKVLVVRGSLNQPETFVVNAKDILEGRAPDFKLQSRDIVFIAEKPWARAEELLDLAGSAFLQAMTVTHVNTHLDPIIENPLYK
ncbi:MAG: SLBB domain-containing protein [Limisphaerales bacterium]